MSMTSLQGYELIREWKGIKLALRASYNFDVNCELTPAQVKIILDFINKNEDKEPDAK
jgi:hypothetical protein